ncbi:hypothetical protein PoB_003845300 [Plakobranchus ocellatus]|uniref:Uncharacterized protein n=1 Tax=Plakobranchus ocellatus TaxID=259542 RepID=A0AAV4AX82_9GAST|nr:hypothetical protein PoB_003845300 [Plakobranchus ocellatus]
MQLRRHVRLTAQASRTVTCPETDNTGPDKLGPASSSEQFCAKSIPCPIILEKLVGSSSGMAVHRDGCGHSLTSSLAVAARLISMVADPEYHLSLRFGIRLGAAGDLPTTAFHSSRSSAFRKVFLS